MVDKDELRHAAEESVAQWLEAEGWSFDEVSCQYWQHPKLGQADDIWAALNRQLDG